jgi:hypothetical protein
MKGSFFFLEFVFNVFKKKEYDWSFLSGMKSLSTVFSLIFENRFLGLFSSSMMMFTAGTVYIFPVISVDLRDILGFSLLEANAIFSISIFGA